MMLHMVCHTYANKIKDVLYKHIIGDVSTHYSSKHDIIFIKITTNNMITFCAEIKDVSLQIHNGTTTLTLANIILGKYKNFIKNQFFK